MFSFKFSRLSTGFLSKIKIFALKGFKATTLDEIAEKSEFGKGTIYNYFSNKENIFKEIIVSVTEEHRRTIINAGKNSDNFYNFILEVTKNHIAFSLHNTELFLLMIFTKMHHEESTSPEIIDLMRKGESEILVLIEKKIRKAIKKKEIRELNPGKMIRLFKGFTYAYIYDLLISKKLREEDIEKEAKFITDIVFNGIILK